MNISTQSSVFGDLARLTNQELVARLVPPQLFSKASFENYVVNDKYPSQALALDAVKDFVTQIRDNNNLALFTRLFSKRARQGRAIYLDGGFGVGKTHLLAACVNTIGKENSSFGSFISYTNLVGALGFNQLLAELSQKRLVCIDEFELDDPADTLLISRLISELLKHQVCVAVTSNTLPDVLGQGRFAAQDFLREIHSLAACFEVVTIEGPDYRRRNLDGHIPQLDSTQRQASRKTPGAVVASLAEIISSLALVHPSRYGQIAEKISVLVIEEAQELCDENQALRFVALVDRLYDHEVPVRVSGIVDLEEMFAPDIIAGCYRKKYLRAISRIASLLQRPLPQLVAPEV